MQIFHKTIIVAQMLKKLAAVWNTMFHRCIHKIPPFELVMSQMNPCHLSYHIFLRSVFKNAQLFDDMEQSSY